MNLHNKKKMSIKHDISKGDNSASDIRVVTPYSAMLFQPVDAIFLFLSLFLGFF